MKPTDLRFRLDRYIYGLQRLGIKKPADRILTAIYEKIDQPAFCDRFRKYWNPFPSSKAYKFLDLNYWFRDNVHHYLWNRIDDMGPGLRILDIGSGCGYFLAVCRHMGHDVLGLDIDEESIYRDSFDFLGLKRIIHRIEPKQPLPLLPHKMDLITAYLTCFNHHADGSPWNADEWQFFIEDLRTRLTDRGRIIIRFNLNHKTGEFYSAEVARMIRSLPGMRAKFLLDYVFLASA